MPSIESFPLTVTLDEAVNYQGLRQRRLVSERSIAVLESVIERIDSENLLEPKLVYNVIPVQSRDTSGFYFDDHAPLHAPYVVKKIRKASAILSGVCTIGDRVSEEVKSLFEQKKRMQAIFLEECANLALFKLSDQFDVVAAQEAQRLNVEFSGPLNPGDQGVDLTAQEQILAMAGAGEIGVTLNSYCMMTPQHSLSVLIGLGKGMKKWNRTKNCDTCKAKDRCRYRLAARRMAS